jgi:hypothetical protein
MLLWTKLLEWKNWILGAAAGLLLLLFGWTKKKQGQVELENQLLRDKERKLSEARKDAADEKGATVGLSDSDVVKRLRSRDDDWRGV